AVSNCLPAVTEAAHAHIPLLVVSADRPAHLIGTGSSQTIDQTAIFGALAPTVTVAAPEHVGRIGQALGNGASQSPRHINVALDMPLVAPDLPEPHGEPGPVDWEQRWVDHGVVDVDLSRNTLVIAGDEAWEIEAPAEVPTTAEPTVRADDHAGHRQATDV